jgi:hypothetical protein
MVEFEVRWNAGRRYFLHRAEAIQWAKTLSYNDVRVLHWGNGAIIWPIA